MKGVTRTFLEISRFSRAETTARKCTKKCAARAKIVFLLIRPIIVVFTVLVVFTVSLALHDFIFSWSKL